METVLSLHNILRWAVLLFGIWTVFQAIGGMMSRRRYSGADNRSNLLFMISCDLQLLLGLILFFSNDWFDKVKAGMGEVMRNANDRFFTMEHGLIMIIAWILVHVGRSSVKRAATDKAKHTKMLIFFGIALLLILVSIPWPFREIVGRPFYRGF